MLLQETELLIVGQICKFRVHNVPQYFFVLATTIKSQIIQFNNIYQVS